MVRLWYGYVTAMAQLWYDNPDIILPHCILLGEEASLSNLEANEYPSDPRLPGCFQEEIKDILKMEIFGNFDSSNC